MPWYKLVSAIIGIALGIFIVCIIIDYFRSLLFKLLHIKDLSDIIGEKITDIYNSLCDRINRII